MYYNHFRQVCLLFIYTYLYTLYVIHYRYLCIPVIVRVTIIGNLNIIYINVHESLVF